MHFVRIIFIFLSLVNAHAINLLLLGAKLGYNAFKMSNLLCSQIKCFTKCVPKWLYVYLSFWMHYLRKCFGAHYNVFYMIFHVLHTKWEFGDIIFLFWHGFCMFYLQIDYLLMLSSFFSDKNLLFSSQRRREEVVGMRMTALVGIMW